MSHTMLYKRRTGSPNPAAWNLPLDTKIVADGEIAQHQAEGWQTVAELYAPPEPAKPRAAAKPMKA